MKKRDKRDRLEQRGERKNARGRRLDFLLNKEGINILTEGLQCWRCTNIVYSNLKNLDAKINEMEGTKKA